jgi:hypothetical protein
MPEIAFVKCEIIDRHEGAARVKVLNGFGEPEIMTIEDNLLEGEVVDRAHDAILTAVAGEDGLDASEGDAVLKAIEKVLPSAKLRMEKLAAEPVR